MEESFRAEYAGALRVPFVNREPLLEKIHQAILDRSRSYVFYITGDGGMGKTYLVREVLRHLRKDGDWHQPDILAATAEVDLYHMETHSPEGLMRAIRAALKPGIGYFGNYLKERDRLERYRQDLENSREVGRQRRRVSEAFIADFAALTNDRRVVLALDTTEVLLYEHDDIQRLLDLEEAGIEARGWLIGEFLPAIENTVVLLAGRPEPPALAEDLRRAAGNRLEEVSLGPLEESDTIKYFDAAAHTARAVGKTRVAEQIESLDRETRQVIHLYTGGRPILLALMIDYLTVADRLLPAVRVSLQEAQSQMPEQLGHIRQSVEADIVRAIQEAGRPADRAILALAWARRGLDATLLSRMIGVEPEPARGLLRELQDLSFVKVRPPDNVCFLQDEMYELLQRHCLDKLLPMQKESDLDILVQYSYEKVEEARQKYWEAQKAYYAGQGEAGSAELAEARLALRRALADEVYYRLRLDPIQGLEAYYRCAEEAFRSSDEDLDLEVRDELLQFLQKAPPEEAQPIQARATWDAGLRWVKRLIVKGNYRRAQEIACRLRAECAGWMQAAGPLAETELDIWEGWLFAYLGQELERAERALLRGLKALEEFAPAEGTFDAWYRQVLMANAHNNLGYLLRVRGSFRKAIEHYRAALPLWRALKNETEHANTLNNLAWALAEVGEFDQALRYAQDGLEMRQRLGPRYPIALSLNTLGLIQVRNDQPTRAEENCRRALAIFHELEQRRGVGLACIALAEALRRRTRVPGLEDIQRNIALLRQAEIYAREAMDIFTREVAEKSRLIEALIELGCIYREWARLRPRYESKEDPKPQELAERGEYILRRAAKEAHELLPHREVDALVNLAWLRHYIKDDAGAAQIIEGEVYSLAEAYRHLESPELPAIADPNAFIWVQLGKAKLLLGQIAFEKYQAQYERLKRQGVDTAEAIPLLQEAARHFALSLAYDELFADHFRDLRAGLDVIYRDLKGLNPQEFQIVYEEVKRTAKNLKLDQRGPSRMQVFVERSFGLTSNTLS